jgi:DNA-binding NarL/FixJ family response regulator
MSTRGVVQTGRLRKRAPFAADGVSLSPDVEARFRGYLALAFSRVEASWQEEVLLVGRAAGLTNEQVAHWKTWSVNTVETYWRNLRSRVQARGIWSIQYLIVSSLMDQLDQVTGLKPGDS